MRIFSDFFLPVINRSLLLLKVEYGFTAMVDIHSLFRIPKFIHVMEIFGIFTDKFISAIFDTDFLSGTEVFRVKYKSLFCHVTLESRIWFHGYGWSTLYLSYSRKWFFYRSRFQWSTLNLLKYYIIDGRCWWKYRLSSDREPVILTKVWLNGSWIYTINWRKNHIYYRLCFCLPFGKKRFPKMESKLFD